MEAMPESGFVKRENGGTSFYSCVALEELGFLRHGFSTRHGGVSPLPHNALNLSLVSWDVPANVHENRRRFLAALHLEAARLATVSQVHSDRLHILDEKTPVENGQADALATRRERIAIAVQVADCFPILVADVRRRVVAAIHAGWRGTLARIVEKTAAGLRTAFGTDPADVVTAIGPGIRSCCFEVGPEVVEQFQAAYPRVQLSRPHPTRSGKYLLDLMQALWIQFEAVGLKADRIFDQGGCTCCNTGEFFSYRREGRHSGRMMGIIALRQDEMTSC
jgi:hypothetical protein